MDHADLGEDRDPSMVPIKLPLGPSIKSEVKLEMKPNLKVVVKGSWNFYGGRN